MRKSGDHGRRLTSAEQLELRRLIAEGDTHASAAAALRCSTKAVQRLLVRTGGLAPRTRGDLARAARQRGIPRHRAAVGAVDLEHLA